MPDSHLAFQVLGPLAVRRGRVELPLGGARQRMVLAHLLVHARQPVPAEQLVGRLWGDATPATGTGPLRTYVSQLRGLLRAGTADPTPLRTRPAGYVLDVADEQIDAARFEQRLTEARVAAASAEPGRALAALDDALSLWQGSALGDLASHPALRAEAVRLDQLRLSAEELRAELLLHTGRHAQAAVDLVALAQANPLREHLWALLMTALYRSGRQGDALSSYQEARSHLVTHLGIEPGPELRAVERAILRQDPGLDSRPVSPRHPAETPAPAARSAPSRCIHGHRPATGRGVPCLRRRAARPTWWHGRRGR